MGVYNTKPVSNHFCFRGRGGGRERGTTRLTVVEVQTGIDYRAAPRRAVACASKIVAELWSITTAHNRTHTTPRSSAPLLEAPAGVRPSL